MPRNGVKAELEGLRRDLDHTNDQVESLRENKISTAVAENQLTSLARDVIDFKTEMVNRFDAHDKVHDKEQQERANGRRWMIGLCVTGVLGFITVLVMIFQVLATVQGIHGK